jgi:large exoprotein involved in heme utilization and adhesion
MGIILPLSRAIALVIISFIINANDLKLTQESKLQSGIDIFGISGVGNPEAVAGDITINTTGELATVSINNSTISSRVENKAEGNGGDIEISAGNLTLINDGQIDARTFGKGNSGVAPGVEGDANDIKITTHNLTLNNESLIGNTNNGQGNSGNININAYNDISLDNSYISNIVTNTEGEKGNDAGDIEIATNNLTLTNSGRVNNTTNGKGNAGSIKITANSIISIDGFIDEQDGNRFDSGILSAVDINGEGNGGEIEIATDNLSLTNSGQINTSTLSKGNAGSINISADTISADNSLILSLVESSAEGNGGEVNIETRNLTLTNIGQINSSTFGQGNGGNIKVTSDNIAIDGRFSGIFSGLTSLADVNAGNIEISTSNLTLTNRGNISTSTFSKGDAGNIKITAMNNIFVDNSFINSGSLLATEALTIAEGNGGDINIKTPNLLLKNGALLTTQSSGLGNAGNIKVTVNTLKLDLSQITASNTPSQTLTTDLEGGNIELNIYDKLILRNSSNITARANQNADGGNVTINAPERLIIAFPNQNNDITANASEGRGGNINITAQSIFGLEERPLNPFTNDINASSEFGLQGDIAINTPDIDPTSGLINLPASVGDASDQISQNPCEQGVGSEFIITGKGGLPPNVNESLNSESAQVGLIETVPSQQQTVGANGIRPNLNNIHPNPSTTPEVVPAQGWVFNDKGEVTLTAYKTTNTGRQSFPKTPINSCSAKPDKI